MLNNILVTDFAEAIDVPEDELDAGKEHQNKQNPSEPTPTISMNTTTSTTTTKASNVSTKQQTTPTVQAYNSPLISIIQSGADYVGEVLQVSINLIILSFFSTFFYCN